MDIKGAIFDVDGTLLDSMFVWKTIGGEYLRSIGVNPRDNLNETFAAMSLQQAACHYQSEYGITLSTDEITGGVTAMIDRYYRHELALKKGAAEFLELLHRKGVRMCIATATDRHLVEAALERLQIRRCFLEIFTCTSVGRGKDEPAIFETALAFLGTKKAETPVFEDAFYAVKTAKAAGFPVIAVLDRHDPHPDRVRAAADCAVHDFYQAKAVLFP